MTKQKSSVLPQLMQSTRQYRLWAKQSREIANSPEVRKTARAIEKVCRKWGVDGQLYASCTSSGADMGVTLTGLDGFKCELLSGILFDLMGELPEATMETKDYAHSLNRDYTFSTKNLRFRIAAYAKEDSPTCKKVKVGSKVVEVDEFKIVCE